jgi:hypothetical protein
MTKHTSIKHEGNGFITITVITLPCSLQNNTEDSVFVFLSTMQFKLLIMGCFAAWTSAQIFGTCQNAGKGPCAPFSGYTINGVANWCSNNHFCGISGFCQHIGDEFLCDCEIVSSDQLAGCVGL